MNVTETGKEIKVTTVVTYEKDFGDGSYYRIVCSNDETGSTYITAAILCAGRQARQILREQNLYSLLMEHPSLPPCVITTIKNGAL